VTRKGRVIIASKERVERGELAGWPKNYAKLLVQEDWLGWDPDGPDIQWDDSEVVAVTYVVELVLGGVCPFGRALVHLLESDIPLGPGMRSKIAGDLAEFYYPSSKRIKTWRKNSMAAILATHEKARLQKTGMSASDAEAAAAAKFGKSVDAIKQQRKRDKRETRRSAALAQEERRQRLQAGLSEWKSDDYRKAEIKARQARMR
jgi:hypothetical protein